MCVSLDEPEPVDSVLTFLSGYDTLEYSWLKATVVSVRLRILIPTMMVLIQGVRVKILIDSGSSNTFVRAVVAS